jgi:hypothetical protein
MSAADPARMFVDEIGGIQFRLAIVKPNPTRKLLNKTDDSRHTANSFQGHVQGFTLLASFARSCPIAVRSTMSFSPTKFLVVDAQRENQQVPIVVYGFAIRRVIITSSQLV